VCLLLARWFSRFCALLRLWASDHPDQFSFASFANWWLGFEFGAGMTFLFPVGHDEARGDTSSVLCYICTHAELCESTLGRPSGPNAVCCTAVFLFIHPPTMRSWLVSVKWNPETSALRQGLPRCTVESRDQSQAVQYFYRTGKKIG
jgi:hypothetical protein